VRFCGFIFSYQAAPKEKFESGNTDLPSWKNTSRDNLHRQAAFGFLIVVGGVIFVFHSGICFNNNPEEEDAQAEELQVQMKTYLRPIILPF